MIPSSDPHLSNRDKDMLLRARNVGLESTMRHKHGAILYKNGRVLAVGINFQRNAHESMEIPWQDYSYHAEHSAMRAYPHNIYGATVYVARVNLKTFGMMNSKPCSDCEMYMQTAGIKRVVYSV